MPRSGAAVQPPRGTFAAARLRRDYGLVGEGAGEAMAIDFDPTDPGFQADPYPTYARLRREAPVLRFETPEGPAWFLSRHADCAAVLRDPRMSAAKIPLGMLPPEPVDPASLHPVARAYLGTMLFLDPPAHTRLRHLVNKAFTPRMVESLRPRIERIADELLEPAAARGAIEWMSGFAILLPVFVIGELLGVPKQDHGRLKAWSNDAASILDGTLGPAVFARAVPAIQALQEYMAELLARRRAEPRDDLLTALVRAQERDDQLADHEILATAILLLAAGHETTTNLLGNGLLALLRDPAALERLRRAPCLSRTAVDELLRFDSPVQATSRRPLEDVEIAGQRFARGEELVVSLGAANRDPAVFADPDRLDLERAPNPHLGFGHGIHFCLGASLARLEAEVAFAKLLARFSKLERVGEPPRVRPGLVFHGLEALPLRLE
jgi:cytochrome P450